MARRVTDPAEPPAPKARVRLLFSNRSDGGTSVVELHGEFDLGTVPEIDRFLRRHLGPQYRQNDLVLDLGGTEFADSSFISFLVALSRDAHAARKELLLARPRGQVARVLALVGVPNVIPVFETVEAALASLEDGPLPVIPPAFRPGRT